PVRRRASARELPGVYVLAEVAVRRSSAADSVSRAGVERDGGGTLVPAALRGECLADAVPHSAGPAASARVPDGGRVRAEPRPATDAVDAGRRPGTRALADRGCRGDARPARS